MNTSINEHRQKDIRIGKRQDEYRQHIDRHAQRQTHGQTRRRADKEEDRQVPG